LNISITKEEEVLMKKFVACFMFAMVCLLSNSVFAQEVPAADEATVPTDDGQNVPADALTGQPVILKCEKNGVCVWAPVQVEVNVPDAPAPEVTVENSIEFPKVMRVKEVDQGFCEGSPFTCVLGGLATVAAGCFVADQLGLFDTTNKVSVEK